MGTPNDKLSRSDAPTVGPSTPDESQTRQLDSFPAGVAVSLSIALFIGSLVLAWYAVSSAGSGQAFTVIKRAGLSMIVLGGCVDPMNFLWICLPFTRNRVSAPMRFARFGRPFLLFGLIVFLVGFVGKFCSSDA